MADSYVGYSNTQAVPLPPSIYLADLFHWKIFSQVDFDSVIEFFRQHGILRCTNIYTAKSLAYELLPNMTFEALRRRKPKKVMGLFALTGKLCVRRKRGLLCYIDMATGFAKKITKFDDFIVYADVPESIQAEQLMVPTDIAFPKLRHKLSLQKSYVPQGGQVTHEVQTTPAPAPTAPAQTFLEKLPVLETPKPRQQDQTAIFSSARIDTSELFITEYKVLSEVGGADATKPFDSLLFAVLSKLVISDPAVNLQGFVEEVIQLLESTANFNFTIALQHTNGDIMHSFRGLYKLPMGDGTANTHFRDCVFKLWEQVTGTPIVSEQSQEYVALHKRMFAILREREEEVAKEAAALEEKKMQDKLSELSHSLKTPTDPGDIIL